MPWTSSCQLTLVVWSLVYLQKAVPHSLCWEIGESRCQDIPSETENTILFNIARSMSIKMNNYNIYSLCIPSGRFMENEIIRALPIWVSSSSPWLTCLCPWWCSQAALQQLLETKIASVPQTPECWSVCRMYELEEGVSSARNKKQKKEKIKVRLKYDISF